jgi:vitamin-K-epoxide reductase (warfarin-sensitive)
MMPRARWMWNAIALFSLAGIVISVVSLYHHYGTSQSSFCDLGGKLNCDIVNRSVYSVFLGVPVALIGVIGYGLLLFLVIGGRSRPQTLTLLLAVSLPGLAFALYLTYIEGWVLGTWCVLCLSSLTMIFLISSLTGFMAALARRSV